MKWEYKVFQVLHNELGSIESELNDAGAEGWDLVQVLVAEMPLRAGAVGLVMKRPKQDREQQEERAPVAMRSYPKGSQGGAA